VIGLIRLPTLLNDIFKNINSRIDQTLLKFNVNEKAFIDFINMSDNYNFRSLVVPSVMVPLAASIAKTPVCGVVGFPFGYHPVETKISEVEYIAKSGGKEVDVVVNVINLKSKRYDAIEEEISKLTKMAHELGLVIKFIVETSVLEDEELLKIAEIVAYSGADFIKTNTGYGPRGASLRDVLLIKNHVGDNIKIKASGGIRNAVDAGFFIIAGADVIGSSSGIKIVEDAKRFLGL
jgi:deoxyribose-phosphate aldolase